MGGRLKKARAMVRKASGGKEYACCVCGGEFLSGMRTTWTKKGTAHNHCARKAS